MGGSDAREAICGQGPAATMRFWEIRTAPFSINGLHTGRMIRARSSMNGESAARGGRALQSRDLAGFLHTGTKDMFARFCFIVTFSQLLFDFFGDQIDGGVEVGLGVLREDVRPRHTEADGAGELAFRAPEVIVLKGDTRAGDEAVEVFELFNFGEDVIFNRFCQRNVVRRKNELHMGNLAQAAGKIHRNFQNTLL